MQLDRFEIRNAQRRRAHRLPEFPQALDPFLGRDRGSSRPQVAVEQRGSDARVVLSLADQRTEVRPGRVVGEQPHHVGEEGAHIGCDVTGVGHRDLRRDALEGLEHDRAFGRPPAIDGLLADAGASGDGLDRDAGVTVLTAQGQRGVDDRQPRPVAAAGGERRAACAGHASSIPRPRDDTHRLDKPHGRPYAETRRLVSAEASEPRLAKRTYETDRRDLGNSSEESGVVGEACGAGAKVALQREVRGSLGS